MQQQPDVKQAEFGFARGWGSGFADHNCIHFSALVAAAPHPTGAGSRPPDCSQSPQW